MRVKLSDRLRMSADMVDRCGVVADIGCDHAHTCIWLIQNGIADRCIGTDVRTGPLQKAAQNLELYECTESVELRLCYGLDAVAPDEADVIIIAGMGGELIRDILERDEAANGITRRTLILQPQSHAEYVRRWLDDNGYTICDESMCSDDDKFYQTIKAVLTHGASSLNEPELYFGPVLIGKGHKVLKELLEIEYRKKKYLLEQIDKSNTAESRAKREEVEHMFSIICDAAAAAGRAD